MDFSSFVTIRSVSKMAVARVTAPGFNNYLLESRCRRIMCPQEYVSGGHIGQGYSVLPDKFA